MNYKIESEALTVCEVKISYQPKVKSSKRPFLNSSVNIYRFLMENEVFPPETIEYKEYFKVMLLNNARKLLGVIHLSEGSIDGTMVDVRHIMQAAILANASGLIICHNHPSGSCRPSLQDDIITTKVQTACNLFGIKLMDHLVITAESYYSYADEGKI